MKQQTFSDYEYENRRRRTRRDLFLATMDEIIPWDAWTEMIQPYYPQGKRGRKPKDLETMLRMYLLQEWYHLTGEGSEDAVYDSYAMRSFIHVDFFEEQVPDSTTLLRFRQMMEKNGLALKLANELAAILREKKLVLLSGTMADAALAAMPEGEA